LFAPWRPEGTLYRALNGKLQMHILLRKLTSLHDVSAEEQAAVVAALEPPIQISRGQDIASEGSTPNYTTVMLSGTACRYKILARGNRHILTFQYPGDMTDLYSYVMKRLDHAVGALSDCSVAHIPHAKVAELCAKYPNLAYTFWRDTVVDTAILHSWALGEGRKTLERVAHMLCEIFVRFEAVGLADLNQPLPFTATQQDLADALGLSLVHTNKTIATLKSRKLIGRTGSKLQILDWEQLKAAANFDAEYLHFKHAAIPIR
jgi:CRP-like cAMP-binding protein